MILNQNLSILVHVQLPFLGLMGKLGYEIVIASRSIEKLEAALKIIGKGDAHVLDVTNEKAVIDFFSSLPPFDHLVISAADFVMGPFLT